jgi:putative MATE family efflux protein
LLRIATPNLAVNVILIAVTASVDAHFVGYLGLDALAGLALVFPFLMLMQQMANMALGGAIAAAVARTLGAGQPARANALACHALVIAAGAAALFSATFLMGGPTLYRLLGERGPVLEAALEYSDALFAGAIAYCLLGALTSIVRGTGHAAILAWVYIAAEVLHIALVPLLVFGWGPVPAFGITGAGLATVISFLASATALAVYLASGRTAITLSFANVRFDRTLFAEILKVGAPMSLAPVLNNAALAALTTYAGVLGATSLAAFGTAVRLEYLLYPLNFSLGAAVLAMMGSNIGARQLGRALRIAWIALGLSAGAMACVSLLALAAPGLWMGLFSGDRTIVADGALYLAIVGLAYPFVAGTLLNSAFQSTRQPQWPLIAMGCRLAVVMLGGWIAVEILDAGLLGIAVVTALGLVTMGGVLIGAFRFVAKLG